MITSPQRNTECPSLPSPRDPDAILRRLNRTPKLSARWTRGPRNRAALSISPTPAAATAPGQARHRLDAAVRPLKTPLATRNDQTYIAAGSLRPAARWCGFGDRMGSKLGVLGQWQIKDFEQGIQLAMRGTPTPFVCSILFFFPHPLHPSLFYHYLRPFLMKLRPNCAIQICLLLLF